MKKFAVDKYNAELAKIYESEEKISGMPIIMKNFNLFSEKNFSSIDIEKFLQVYDDRTAETNFNEDLKICQTLNIHRLPSKFEKTFTKTSANFAN